MPKNKIVEMEKIGESMIEKTFFYKHKFWNVVINRMFQ